jgi:predicted lipoprotein with Yx(FWY)xxD motif
MRTRFPILAVLSALAIIATACGAQASSPSVAPYGKPTSAAIPATGATATQAMPPTSMPAAATQPPSTDSSGYGGGDYGYGSGSGTTATQAAPAPAAGDAAQVALASNPQLGSILADSAGKTLYLFTRDTANTPSCYGGCASAWPPLLASSGSPAAATGLDASKLGTAARTDGTTQVTYNGWPLYYFAKDLQPGDVNGQGLFGSWFVVSPTGDPIR